MDRNVVTMAEELKNRENCDGGFQLLMKDFGGMF